MDKAIEIFIENITHPNEKQLVKALVSGVTNKKALEEKNLGFDYLQVRATLTILNSIDPKIIIISEEDFNREQETAQEEKKEVQTPVENYSVDDKEMDEAKEGDTVTVHTPEGDVEGVVTNKEDLPEEAEDEATATVEIKDVDEEVVDTSVTGVIAEEKATIVGAGAKAILDDVTGNTELTREGKTQEEKIEE